MEVMTRKKSTASRSMSRRDTTLSGESKYESADETFQDEELENRRKKQMSRKSSVAKLIRQASSASMSVYNGARKVFGGSSYNVNQRRRSSVRRKHGVDRPLIELVRERILELIQAEQAVQAKELKKETRRNSIINNNITAEGPFHPKDLLYIKETDDMIVRFLKEYFEDHPYDDSKCEEETIAVNVAAQVIETLKWRFDLRINDMKDSDFPREFYECGLCSFGEDSDGNPVVFIRGKKCRKTPPSWTPILLGFVLHESEKKMIEIFGDPMNPKNPTAKPGVVCDVSNVSVMNVDMNLVFSLLPLTKHYPQSFCYVWVYELPWLAKPFFNIIIKMLPGRIVRKVKQMDKKSAINEMGIEGIPTFMGGKSLIEPTLPVPPDVSTIEEVGRKNGIPEADIKKMAEVIKEMTKA
jgi:hypothetical protein